ncbi:MAG: DNA-directed RNA polymerase subunit D [Methanosarcinaceae archaeon]|nr:DNA-directed RNA polymerase subunit D [Methanosarcinaceae archaeon]
MEMDIDIIELSDRSSKFILSGVNAAFANGIRRAMLADVPTLAIEYIDINDNTSVLYDEQLGLRLAMIPLKMSPDYVPQSECSCGGVGCPACEVSLRLDETGPGEDERDESSGRLLKGRMIYSGDFKSSDPAVRPADDKIPIIELKTNQRVMLRAIAHVGYGRDHVRWQAGIACGYKNMPVITVNDCDVCGHCTAECPKNIIELGSTSVHVNEEDMIRCSLCRLCERACGHDPKGIVISSDPNVFVFTMESDGSYSAKELVLKAADVIREHAQEFGRILESI